MSSVTRWGHYFDLIDVLTRMALRARYRTTYLGYIWSLLNPLAYALVFHVAFKAILRVDVPNYTVFLLAGLFPWQWISNSLGGAPVVFISNSVLLKKIRSPRNLFVLSQVIQDGFHFILSIPVVLLVLIHDGRYPTLGWLWGLPLLLLLQFALIYGLGLLLATCNVFFRDLERLVALGLFLVFYLTPVVFPADMVPLRYAWILKVNPFAYLISGWRSLFLDGAVPTNLVVGASFFAVFALLLGHAVYTRLQWKFAEAL